MQTGQAQHVLNLRLKKQLDSVMIVDQKYRSALSLLMSPASADSVAKSLNMTVTDANQHLWKLQNTIDSANIVFIERVLKKHGYPGKTLVGKKSSEAAWLIIQHSTKIDQYLPIIKKAANAGELNFNLYAMMLDRDLMNKNKEQIYGSQCTMRTIKASGKNEWIIWPIKNPAHINQRRKAAGFEDSVEDYAKDFDIKYRVVKLSDIML